MLVFMPWLDDFLQLTSYAFNFSNGKEINTQEKTCVLQTFEVNKLS